MNITSRDSIDNTSVSVMTGHSPHIQHTAQQDADSNTPATTESKTIEQLQADKLTLSREALQKMSPQAKKTEESEESNETPRERRIRELKEKIKELQEQLQTVANSNMDKDQKTRMMRQIQSQIMAYTDQMLALMEGDPDKPKQSGSTGS